MSTHRPLGSGARGASAAVEYRPLDHDYHRPLFWRCCKDTADFVYDLDAPPREPFRARIDFLEASFVGVGSIMALLTCSSVGAFIWLGGS